MPPVDIFSQALEVESTADEPARHLMRRIDSFSGKLGFEWPLYLYSFYQRTKHSTVASAQAVLEALCDPALFLQFVTRVEHCLVFDYTKQSLMGFAQRGDYDFAWHPHEDSCPKLIEYVDSDIPDGILAVSIPQGLAEDLARTWFVATRKGVFTFDMRSADQVVVHGVRYQGGFGKYETRVLGCKT